jgi:regulator of RNase E activity RraB
MSDWDFERQKSETEDTVSDLKENQNVPVGPEAKVTLDVFLLPGDDADEEALERALAMFGYAGDPGETEDKEPVYVVSIPDVALTAEDIWLHEERVTKIAVTRGYTPDGWGFFEPDDAA